MQSRKLFFSASMMSSSRLFSQKSNLKCWCSFFLLLQSVGQVYAEDADDGINGEIYYSLIDPKSSFAVDPVTGVIFLTRPLSHHKQPQHEIAIMAQDRGAKSRFATRAPDTAKVQLSVRQVRKKISNQFLEMMLLDNSH